MALDPQSRNLTIPRGVVLFAPFRLGTYLPGAFFDIGNCNEFTLSRENTMLTHYSNRGGMSLKDFEAPMNSDMSGTIVTDDMGKENVMRWLMGTSTTVTTSAQTAQTEEIEGAVPGAMYQIGRTEANPLGTRNITVTAATAGGTALVEFGDYMIDGPTGLLTIMPGSTAVQPGGTDISITYSVAASTYTKIESGEVSHEGELRFISQNPIGPNRLIVLPRARLSPSGDWAQMTDGESPTWQTLSYAASVLKKGNLPLALNADGLPAISGV